jgi:transposase
MHWYGVADVNCYSASGKKVSVFLARLLGKVFECPECKHRWDIRTIS